MKIHGFAIIKVVDRRGVVKHRIKKHNVVTNVGIAGVASLVAGLSTAPFTYIAIGEGSPVYPGQCAPTSATDTALGYEIGRKSATYTLSHQSTGVYFLETTVVFSSADGLTGVRYICEAGIFNAPTDGIMLDRITFTTVPVDFDTGDEVYIQYIVAVSNIPPAV